MRRVLSVLVILVLMYVPGAAHAVTPDARDAVKPGPPTAGPADVRFTPGRTLRTGSPSNAGLLPGPIAKLAPDIAAYTKPSPTYPEYPGAVVLAARNGVIAANDATGYAVKYKDDKPTEFPKDQQIPARPDTIYDLASMSKLFTTIAAVQQIERGTIKLDAPVATYLPEFARNGKDAITIRMLLTHTSGLEPDLPFYKYDGRAAQEEALYEETPQATPGTAYVYSDLNMITMQFVLEKVTGRTLDALVRDGITKPLRMTDTMYNPPASLRPRIAATEDEHVPPAQLNRGLVWGQVHDENAYALGGVAGHAGVFSTTRDLAVLAQTILDGGRYGNARILDEDSVRLLFTDFNSRFPGNAHGLGFELNLPWYMDGMCTPVTMGHTGFTGTSIVIDPLSHSFVILLTNRVHPSRDWGSNNPSRRAVARDVARAVPVRPATGRDAWFAGQADDTTATLTAPIAARKVAFDLWYDTESTDTGAFEASPDGTTWAPVPLTLRAGPYAWTVPGTFSGFAGRRWATATAALPAGTKQVRWRYTTDPLNQGRGVYVDAVRAWDAAGHLAFDGDRTPDAFTADGWTRSGD